MALWGEPERPELAVGGLRRHPGGTSEWTPWWGREERVSAGPRVLTEAGRVLRAWGAFRAWGAEQILLGPL